MCAIDDDACHFINIRFLFGAPKVGYGSTAFPSFTAAPAAMMAVAVVMVVPDETGVGAQAGAT